MRLSEVPLDLPAIVAFFRRARVAIEASGACDVSLEMSPAQFIFLLENLEAAELFQDLVDEMDKSTRQPRS